ncbi:hypothetical protein A176_002978 [Myxococcus hansupus]|uniref:Lipoprotein n=1 Tax=Pseudomyxococcus hansupus TaxID=1297742 RepID=A0A0H4WRF6_9BACT|nr:hypothetical protein [Myxococcus hansupus]AKQ66066.1 hypothetical protein A176_002978 [Myxococcus hansupus]
MSALPRGLIIVCTIAAAACGGIRKDLGEDAYLRQQLYDYGYDIALDTLWETAKQMAESTRDESRSEDGVRTAVVAIRRASIGDETTLEVLLMRGWEEGGRSYVKFFKAEHGASFQPHDISAREVNTELDLLGRIVPADAAKVRQGASRAGQRAR